MTNIARRVFGNTMYADIMQHDPDFMRRVAELLSGGCSIKQAARVLVSEYWGKTSPGGRGE